MMKNSKKIIIVSLLVGAVLGAIGVIVGSSIFEDTNSLAYRRAHFKWKHIPTDDGAKF
jgi:hypothetical protein